MSRFVREHFRWNFTVNLLERAFFSFALGFAGPYTIIPVFIHEHCSSDLFREIRPLLIGLISALNSVGWHLPQVVTASYVAKLDRKKPFVLTAGLFQRFPFLIMGILIAFWDQSGGDLILILFFILYALQTFGGGFVGTAWQELIATVIPPLKRGVFFGSVFLAGGLLMILGGQFAGLILSHISRPKSYALCFTTCFLLTMISWAFLALNREPPIKTAKAKGGDWGILQNFPQVARKDPNWRAYVFSQFLVIPAGIICVFVPVWGRFKLGVSDYEIGLMTSVAAVGETVGNPFLGFWGDRKGHKLCLGIACAALVASLFSILVFPWRFGLYLSLFMIGLYTSGRKVSGTAITFEFCKPEERPIYIGVTNTLLGLFFAVGAVVGGFFVMKFGYTIAFALGLLFAGAGFSWLVLFVREPRHFHLYSKRK